MITIKVEGLEKNYIKSKSPKKRFFASVFNKSKLNKKTDLFTALEDIRFSVSQGECLGIVGKNGSGKSTLLKILAGITSYDKGSCEINGSISALLELGVGFNPEYTGIQNIYLNGTINGFTKHDVKSEIGNILDFAEISDEFANMPVKTYSTGMLLRLGFASMLWIDSDIILIDEILAVGDYRFQAKCFKKFESLKEQGKTIVFVSHDVNAVRRFCTKAIWIDNGRIAYNGDVDYVTSKYMQSCVDGGIIRPSSEIEQGVLNKYGSHIGSIKEVKIDKRNIKIGDEIIISVKVHVPRGIDLSSLDISLSVKDKMGLDLCVFQTGKQLRIGENMIVFRFTNCFNQGDYLISVGLENKYSIPITYYEYIEGVVWFKSVNNAKQKFGLITTPCDVNISYN